MIEGRGEFAGKDRALAADGPARPANRTGSLDLPGGDAKTHTNLLQLSETKIIFGVNSLPEAVMSFKIEERFEVLAPVERVWKYLTDPAQVVQCLPGAELLEMQDERTFLGALKVKVGPLSMSYKGKGQFTELNEQLHQVRMVGEAREVGGSGSTKVTMLSTVTALEKGGAEVVVNAEVDLVGKIVQFGRGMIEEVSRQMFREFSNCVKRQLEIPDAQPAEQIAAPAEARGVSVVTLAFRALSAIIARFFRRLSGRTES
jgi:carbon monoxide dehydrogenase subunit G